MDVNEDHWRLKEENTKSTKFSYVYYLKYGSETMNESQEE